MYKFLNFPKNIYLIILLLFSFLINYYYGSIGVLPQDTFAYFDTSYRILNGAVPFKDYWTVSGPFIDYFQAVIFYIFGINWNSYILNGCIINCGITILFYIVLINFNLKKTLALFYSLSFSILANPSMGAPFTDHYSAFFALAGIFFFLLGVKSQKKIYWFLVPIFFFIGFLSKQSPSSYLLITIIILSIFYLFYFKNFIFLNYFFLSSVFCFLFLFFYLILNDIQISQFLDQYFFYPQTIANERLKSFNPDIKNIFLNYKFIYLFLFILIFLTGFNIFNNKTNSRDEKQKIINNLAVVMLTVSLVFHQIITKNFIFIFFVIPLIGGFIHSNINHKDRYKEYLSFFLIIATLAISTKYHLRFNENRKMLNLEKVNLSKAVDSSLLHPKLKGLKWITKKNPENPIEEINLLKDTALKIKKDKSKKMIMTGYLFFSVILNEDLNNPSRWPSLGDASNPNLDNKFHVKYKDFVKNLIINKKIETIYSARENIDDIFTVIFEKNCIRTQEINDFFVKHDIKNCLNNKNEYSRTSS